MLRLSALNWYLWLPVVALAVSGLVWRAYRRPAATRRLLDSLARLVVALAAANAAVHLSLAYLDVGVPETEDSSRQMNFEMRRADDAWEEDHSESSTRRALAAGHALAARVRFLQTTRQDAAGRLREILYTVFALWFLSLAHLLFGRLPPLRRHAERRHNPGAS